MQEKDEMTSAEEANFELPEVEKVKAAVRVSISDNICLSCQG